MSRTASTYLELSAVAWAQPDLQPSICWVTESECPVLADAPVAPEGPCCRWRRTAVRRRREAISIGNASLDYARQRRPGRHRHNRCQGSDQVDRFGASSGEAARRWLNSWLRSGPRNAGLASGLGLLLCTRHEGLAANGCAPHPRGHRRLPLSSRSAPPSGRETRPTARGRITERTGLLGNGRHVHAVGRTTPAACRPGWRRANAVSAGTIRRAAAIAAEAAKDGGVEWPSW